MPLSSHYQKADSPRWNTRSARKWSGLQESATKKALLKYANLTSRLPLGARKARPKRTGFFLRPRVQELVLEPESLPCCLLKIGSHFRRLGEILAHIWLHRRPRFVQSAGAFNGDGIFGSSNWSGGRWTCVVDRSIGESEIYRNADSDD